MRACSAFAVLFALLMVTHPASSHEMRPGYLEIREVGEAGVYDVLWKVPARGGNARLGLGLQFGEDVQIITAPVGGFVGGAHVQRMRIRGVQGLNGTSIEVEGLERTFTDVLLRLERADGTDLTHRLTPDAPRYVVEANPSGFQVAWTYFLLGIEHILGGIDHLLFVLALLLVVQGGRKLVATVTAFTIAHSITLALATLGFVHVPGPPVEATIALSIMFVAAEILRGQNDEPRLTARKPWIVAFTFGLLHGFGFAGALSEVGLPQSAIPAALLTFNLGVEAGQLLFVFGCLAAWVVLHRVPISPPVWSQRLPAYAIGSVAAFWTIERVAAFWA